MKKILHGVVLLGFALAFSGCTSERFFSIKGVKAVDHALYKEECGACHFSYPPGLLPSGSWTKITTNLADHFGDDAELEPEDTAIIAKYLQDNSAGQSFYKRSRKIMHSLDGATPLRITEVPYIERVHKPLPKEQTTGNPKVNSMSNCNACHTKSEKGIFDDDTVFIPNYGPWDSW